MKLVNVRIRDFRCIEDSGEFSFGPTTCLVGKNESGKTAILQALEKLNPVDSAIEKYDMYRDCPRVKLSEFNAENIFIDSSWLLDDSDVAAIEEKLGESALKDKIIHVSKQCDGTKLFDIKFDHKRIVKYLLSDSGCDAEEQKIIELTCKGISDLAQVGTILGKEKTERIKTITDKIKQFRNNDPSLGAIDILSKRMPKFLYFSSYDKMNGNVSINDLVNKQQTQQLKKNDHVFLSFLDFAGTNLEEVKALTHYEPLKAKAESVGIVISKKIFKYWSQNQHLKVQFDVRQGLPADPSPFNSGLVISTRILNTLHDMTVEFDNRSAGFVWFFSFLVLFSQVEKRHGNVIILLDEPGLNLHGKAQSDLLRFIEKEIEPTHQIIYTTHSPFMIPPRRLEIVRTVEDVVVEKEDGEKEVWGTKVGDKILSKDPDTVFPLQGALGYDISQSLFVGPDTLLVEGPSDILYLHAFSAELTRRKRIALNQRWTICPTGGIDKVGAFVSLFAGKDLHVAILADVAQGQKTKIEQLKTSQLLESGHVLVATDFTGTAEADIEDLLGNDLYLSLVNSSLGLTGKKKIEMKEIAACTEKTPRILKKVEAVLRSSTERPELNHYMPSMWLIRNPNFLEGDAPEITGALDRFEKLFIKINSLLK